MRAVQVSACQPTATIQSTNSLSSLLINAGDNHALALIRVRWYFQIDRRRNTLKNPACQIECGTMTRSGKAALPFVTTQILRTDIRTVRTSSTQVCAETRQN